MNAYHVVYGKSPANPFSIEAFVEEVNQMLQRGYTPHGGLTIESIRRSGGSANPAFYQPMILHAPDELHPIQRYQVIVTIGPSEKSVESHSKAVSTTMLAGFVPFGPLASISSGDRGGYELLCQPMVYRAPDEPSVAAAPGPVERERSPFEETLNNEPSPRRGGGRRTRRRRTR